MTTTNFDDFKGLFFADQTLEELAKTLQGSRTEPWSLFISAFADSQQNDLEAAKASLHRMLAIPESESRVRLLAWRSLRAFGEQPPAITATDVQGVISELHNEAGIGTIAAYADGSARWLGGGGRITIWDASYSDAHIDALIRGLMNSAKLIVDSTEPRETHQSPEPPMDYFRVSVLTFGGVHVKEVFGPDITIDDPMTPLLTGSVDMLEALSAKL